MLYGVHIFPTQSSYQPAELAQAAEERGLESVWFSEHSHVPLRYLDEAAQTSPMPDHYWQTYDIFIAMTLAAAATRTIRIGTGIALVVERNPIFLAKETATFDLISNGRFVFGIGAGWLEPEMADHGVAYRTRFQLLKEQIQAIQAIWTTDEAEYHGKFVNFDRMKAYPKPYQQPHPPIIMGGEGDRAIECAAEFCDGWAPWCMEWPKVKEAIAKLHTQAIAHGRDPASLEISVFEKALPDPKTIAEMEAAGIKRIILTILGQSRAQALPTLDSLAELIR